MTSPSSLSLYEIESDLAQLCEERDRADSEGDSEAVAVLDGLIAGYLTKEAQKVDSGAALIRSDLASAELLRAEAARLLDRAKAFEARAERIKRAWCEAMAAQGIKELKSPHATIRRQANGGVRPLVVHDPAAVTPEFARYTVPMSGRAYRYFLQLVADAPQAIAVLDSAKYEPDVAMIRAALERGEQVPGCKLAEKGEHLRVL